MAIRSTALLLTPLFGVLVATSPRTASAQACCAGASAVTPGRLALHERALVGVRARADVLFGSFDSQSSYVATPSGTAAWDFEQDVFASLRVLRRGQLSVLVPFVESWRRTPTTGGEFGGGIGDVNASVRYDFTWAREVSYLPGIALLAGVTLPTGRAPESAENPLGSDATGVGAAQANFGVALERAFDHVLVNVTGLAAKRLRRDVHGVESDLGTQLTLLAAGAYVFDDEGSLATALTFTTEGPASVDGVEAPGTARRSLRLTLAGSIPFSDTWRGQAALFLDPPLSGLGKNQPATTGAAATVLWSFL